MKRITKKEAIDLIHRGIFPKCETSRDIFIPVRTLADLQRLEDLSTVQNFILWGYEDSDIDSFVLPEDSLQVSIDEAADLILDNKDKIYVKIMGEEDDIIFFNSTQLNSFVRTCRDCELEGIPFLVYWRE